MMEEHEVTVWEPRHVTRRGWQPRVDWQKGESAPLSCTAKPAARGGRQRRRRHRWTAALPRTAHVDGTEVPKWGLRVREVRGRHSDRRGVEVVQLQAGGLGERCGLTLTDVIMMANDAEVDTVAALQRHASAGKSVVLRVQRDGRRHLSIALVR